MTVDERSRHALYLKLEGILGREEATPLMEHLPPVGWADVATKHDLDQLKIWMTARMESMERRMETMEYRLLATFRKELTAQTRSFALAMTGSFLTASGIAVAAAVAL
jgi:hypothetical protein